ncbi:MAG: dockerin type I domain-containing protein [Oscillospiraceae bacterium]|nr:dockerin type I domain-containing protein [Oscillospiraceae bacterium]
MKKAKVARVICVILSAALILPVFAFGSSAASTITKSNGACPVIVVNDAANAPLFAAPLSAREVQVFPPSKSEQSNFMLGGLITCYTLISEQKWREVTETLFGYGGIVRNWVEPIYCNTDGTSKTLNAVGPRQFDKSLDYYIRNKNLIESSIGDVAMMVGEEIGYNMTYIYAYDWRLDPIKNAAGLNDFIQKVKAETGYKKVGLVSEGTGGIVTSAYLAKYGSKNNYADLDRYVTINSAAQGSRFIGDVYMGRLDLDPNGFIRYLNDFSDNAALALGSWISLYVLNKEWLISEMAANIDFYLGASGEKLLIYNNFARDFLKNIPGLWAMVPYQWFEGAMQWMYPKEFDPINKNLSKALYEYHEIQGNSHKYLKAADAAGVKCAVVSGYNMQSPPIVESSAKWGEGAWQSDGLVDTDLSSFGCKVAFLNNDWVTLGKTMKGQEIDDGHTHTNELFTETGRATIDASSCALPESTWFIRGMKRNNFDCRSDEDYYFLRYLVFSAEKPTVWDCAWYPQFMTYDRFNIPKNFSQYKSLDALKSAIGDELTFNSKTQGLLWGINRTDIKKFYIVGDVDLDGEVSAADARLVLRHSADLVTLTRISAINADADFDGEITAADARLILRHIAGLVDKL